MKAHRNVLLVFSISPSIVHAGPYSELNPFASSIFSLIWYGVLIMIVFSFFARSIKETRKNLFKGIAYFILRVSLWTMPFIMLYVLYQFNEEPNTWLVFGAFGFGIFISFKLIDINEKYFPFDE